jgi:hypothetical protein
VRAGQGTDRPAGVRSASRIELLESVCDQRPINGQVVELVLQPLRGKIPADPACARVTHLQAIQRVIDAPKPALQSENLELAKHDESPRT